MALRFIDGFDHYTTRDQFMYKYNDAASSSYVATSSSGRRTGSYAARIYTSSGYISKTIDDQSTWIVGAAIKLGAIPSGAGTLFQFRDATGTTQACLVVTTTGSLALYRGGSSGSLLASSSNALTEGVWNYIEAKLTIADSGGSFEVRVNGETWASYTGDTKYSSSYDTANTIRFNGFPAVVYVYYDDLYICDGTGTVDNDFLGDCRVDTIFPSAAGNAADFTPTGSTNNYENVDETSPDDATSYNASSTVDATDSFAFENLSALDSTILGVQENMIACKDDAGTRILHGLTRLDGTNYEGSDLSLSDSYLNHTQIWETNPATSAAWTEAEINAAEFGYKVES